ncbi:Hsp70 family protein [Rhodococcus sp. KRD162]|uniref:Hsp70 family protein n=1 Tax=Rhodococcus sp. KRD162 TaxID=2729725 RepID=UPI0019D168C5|nr:Hsp70 family protein [Rhodococcus sp. KRD162]
MSAVTGASVLGASLGSSGVRSVISDDAHSGAVLEVHEPVSLQPAPNGLAPDPWDSVITSVHNLANEYASAHFYPVLALRESEPRTAYDQDFSDGVVLVSELGAQLVALQQTGVLAGEFCVALFDVGASGTSVSVVEVGSGRVLASRRTGELSGDECDRLLRDHLIGMFGAAEALTVDARRRLVSDVRVGKHELSLLRSVSVRGPFVGGRASLWRGNLDELIGDAVHRAVSMAVDVLDEVRARGAHVDAIVAVGGGANMQIVRKVLFDAVSIPVYVPEQPELLAARGAAGIARMLGVRPAPSTDDARTEQIAAVGHDADVSAVVTASAVASKRPRHSGTSATRMARAHKSRHLGRALAALVVLCAAGTVAAAAARSTGEDASPVVSSPTPSTQATRSQSVVPAADGSPAGPEESSLPAPTVTAAPTSDGRPAPSPAATTVTDVATTTSPLPLTPSGSPSGRDDSTVRERPAPGPATTVPTTEAPRTTTRAPSTTTSVQTTTAPSTTPEPTTTTTTRSTTTTRPTRTFDFPLPKLGLPGG